MCEITKYAFSYIGTHRTYSFIYIYIIYVINMNLFRDTYGILCIYPYRNKFIIIIIIVVECKSNWLSYEIAWLYQCVLYYIYTYINVYNIHHPQNIILHILLCIFILCFCLFMWMKIILFIWEIITLFDKLFIYIYYKYKYNVFYALCM